MSDTLVDIIRHGESEGGRRFRGHGCDDPLSEKGWQQMWSAVGQARPWTRIVSSPMIRCRAFAEALAERHGLLPDIDERLKEVGFGSWEGRAASEIDPEEYRRFYADPVNDRPQGAEPLDLFGRRVADALDSAVDHTGEHTLIVAHAGVIRACVGHVLRAAPIQWYRTQVPNAALSRFKAGEHGLQLVYLNRLTMD